MAPQRTPHTLSRLSKVNSLVRWWRTNGRRYPWRSTDDPFQVLVAEILLHRTRADQVLPVYIRLLALCGSPKALLEHEAKARKLLKTLGLRWRTDLLFRMAHELVQRYDGKIPRSRDELTQLPGVSDYIAGAVRCFTEDSPEILLDTNIVRVIGRVEGLPVRDASRRSRIFRHAAENWVQNASPKETYCAIIDLAASLCLPHNPLCSGCPIATECRYARIHQTGAFGRLSSPGSQLPFSGRTTRAAAVSRAPISSRRHG